MSITVDLDSRLIVPGDRGGETTSEKSYNLSGNALAALNEMDYLGAGPLFELAEVLENLEAEFQEAEATDYQSA
jgi:hypothetical protein